MNFNTQKQIFSFRKYKAYGLASAVIASMFLAQGVVSADVVTSPDGAKTTLSNDKASVTVDSNHFKESNDKTAKELYEAKEYEADKVTTGKDTVTDESKTVVSFETENGTKLKDDVTKTATEEKQLEYKVEGASGKEYTGTSTTTSTVNADLEKQDTINKDGEKYKYVRTETTQGSETVLTNTQFNDVETKASVEGMHNEDGSIKYDKIKDGSRVWVLEEKEDGTYGNYALIENAQGLSDEKIQEAAKTATTKFSKAEVEKLGGIKETDSIVVYETNTYAARKQASTQYGKDFYYEFTANSSKLYKSYIDDIYNVGLDGLEKQGDKYVYKGKEVVTIEDFKTIYETPAEDSELLGTYTTDTSNKYYTSYNYGTYAVPTTYYDVISDFLIAHPDSPLFAGKYKDVFWGNGDELVYFKTAFVARLLNDSLKSKYNLNLETPNFSNKPLDSKADGTRPIEKKTYSFVRTDLKGDEESYAASTNLYLTDDDLLKHEISLSYSQENIEKVRNWIKGFNSMLGDSVSDPFNNKPTSEITKQEYTDVTSNIVYGYYLSTYKGKFTPEQVKELRTKFGDSVFEIVGNIVSEDLDPNNSKNYVINGEGSHIFRNSLGVVNENTEQFTYHDVVTPLRAYRLTADNNLVRHIYEQVKRGSVVATYSDEEGNKLADDVNVKTNEYEGEDYTTSAKEIRPIYKYETVNGLTKTTTTTYELIKTPDNANGKVVAETTITVPYVYRKVVTVVIKGSVIATYKDEDGTILASEEKVITNQNAGTYYAAASKPIQAATSSKETEHGRKVTVITYELIKTPDNETGEVVGGETLIVPYVYRKVVTVKSDGGVVATHKDTEGNDLAPKEVIKSHSPEGDVYKTKAKSFDPVVTTDTVDGLTRTTTTTYELVETPTNANGQVKGGETIKVPYVYRKVVKQEINGSVVVTHHDENGVQLALDEKVKDNAKAGEPYTTSPKQFDSSITTNHVNGLTQKVFARYELVRIPANDSGEVEGGKTLIVPYIYHRVESISTYGSVVATYKDTEGNELAPQVDVKTDVEPGQAYDTEVKRFPIQTLSESKPTDDVVKVTVTEYRLVKTPENKSGKVKDGQVTVVPYVYEKVVSVHYEKKDTLKPKFEIPKDAPKVNKEEVKFTRFMLEDRRTTVKDMEDGFVGPDDVIGSYTYTGVTDSDEGGAVITHIYRQLKPSEMSKIPNESPIHDKPELNVGVIPNDAPNTSNPELKVTRFILEDGVTEVQGSVTGLVDAPTLIGKYVFTGKTELDASGSVRTHIYKLVEGSIPNDAPILEKPELKIPEKEVPTPEVPTPETPVAEVEKPSQPVAQKPQEKFATKELPNTGTEVSQSSALGILGIVSSLGLLGFVNKRKETEDKD